MQSHLYWAVVHFSESQQVRVFGYEMQTALSSEHCCQTFFINKHHLIMTKLCACFWFCAGTNLMKQLQDKHQHPGWELNQTFAHKYCLWPGQSVQPWPVDSPDNNSLLKLGSSCLLWSISYCDHSTKNRAFAPLPRWEHNFKIDTLLCQNLRRLERYAAFPHTAAHLNRWTDNQSSTIMAKASAPGSLCFTHR